MEVHRNAIIRYFKDGSAYLEILEILKTRGRVSDKPFFTEKVLEEEQFV